MKSFMWSRRATRGLPEWRPLVKVQTNRHVVSSTGWWPGGAEVCASPSAHLLRAVQGLVSGKRGCGPALVLLKTEGVA
eukprot:3702692-Amphidinium_carterae.1